MAKYRLNLSFDIDITADEDSEVSEEEMVKMLQQLYHNDRKEFLESLRYCFEEEKVAYNVELVDEKGYTVDNVPEDLSAVLMADEKIIE
jgi:hypothetical protein